MTVQAKARQLARASHQATMALYQQQAQQAVARAYVNCTQTTCATATNAPVYQSLQGTGTTSVPLWLPQGQQPPAWWVPDDYPGPLSDVTIRDGQSAKVNLPDGSIIDVKADGSFTIEDSDAKVTYRANRVRDFNSYVNASDKLESFIRFCGDVGVKQSEMLSIPIKHFIAWLIVESALADGEEPQTALPDLSQWTAHDAARNLDGVRSSEGLPAVLCREAVPSRSAHRDVPFGRDDRGITRLLYAARPSPA